MQKLSKAIVIFLCTALFGGMFISGLADKAALAAEKKGAGAELSDQDISDAYLYLLARLLVLRQEILDFKNEGFKWNTIIYRKPGGVAWANPNLDVAYSEAWVAIDENTPVILEVPKIDPGRYYTWQMLNGWGETTLNINERTFPNHPHGKFAFVLKGTNPTIPGDALKVELPNKKSRVLARVELGSDPAEAERLQHQFKLTVAKTVKVTPPVAIPLFSNDKLPGAEAFDKAGEILASEPDINPGMEPLQKKVKAVEALVKSGQAGRDRVDKVIRGQAQPRLKKAVENLGEKKNGWARPSTIGNYGKDFVSRTVIDLIGIWANNTGEVVYFKTNTDGKGTPLDGGNTYCLEFPKGALPIDKVKYFWSVIAVDSVKFQVIPNPLNRFLLNKESGVKLNEDGSLTLWFAPQKPAKAAEANWLPTPAGQNYNLTFRFYGPSKDLVDGSYFPPPLVKVE
ncbi:MAG: DUF1214 domain-containing protein [Deltaproteobacteria bacterium]